MVLYNIKSRILHAEFAEHAEKLGVYVNSSSPVILRSTTAILILNVFDSLIIQWREVTR